MKQGILVVSFGTTHSETRQKNIGRIVEMVRQDMPDTPVYEAYSSNVVRRKLLEQEGIRIMDIREALEQMTKDFITDVRILPTHIIDGVENHRMKKAAEDFRGKFDSIRIAKALLEEREDYQRAAEALWEELEPLTGEHPLILMGHGTYHQADICYQKIEQELREYTKREVYVATVEGKKDIAAVIGQMQESGTEKGRVVLAPLMLVAGEHAVHDMAGEKNSFASALRDRGYEPYPVFRGIGEYPRIRELYLGHLHEICG